MHDEVQVLDAALWGSGNRQNVNWMLDADISSFFDEIDHDWMLKFLELRILDRRMLGLIRKWLKAGVMEDGCRAAANKGTPQGAVTSPLLANIYLHYNLDQWTQQRHRRYAGGNVIVVRYADDNVIGLKNEETAIRFLTATKERQAKFGLTLNATKTPLIEFGRFAATNRKRRGQSKPETFDFLGFTHCCGTYSQGRFQVTRLTVKKRKRVALEAIRAELMRRRHESVVIVGKWLNRVVQGYFNYHAVPGNLYRLVGMRSEIGRAWRHALMRRNQRHRLPWHRFSRIAERIIPAARNTHSSREERFYASHT